MRERAGRADRWSVVTVVVSRVDRLTTIAGLRNFSQTFVLLPFHKATVTDDAKPTHKSACVPGRGAPRAGRTARRSSLRLSCSVGVRLRGVHGWGRGVHGWGRDVREKAEHREQRTLSQTHNFCKDCQSRAPQTTSTPHAPGSAMVGPVPVPMMQRSAAALRQTGDRT